MRVMILGNWGPYVGTDYCYALGIFDSLKDAEECALDTAWQNWEEDDEDLHDEDGKYLGEGPDYRIEEYDPDKHDQLKAGGGSFDVDFITLDIQDAAGLDPWV